MSTPSLALPSARKLRRLLPAPGTEAPWVPVWSVPAALRAVRATLVVPGLFALCSQVIGNGQMAIFAAFGGFATLLFAAFGGSRRDKLVAHLVLACAGSVLLVIGTAVNSSTALAAVVTVAVAFVVLFAGVGGPNAASGGTAAMLAYVLPAASPGTISMVPSRLEGWWLASAVGTAAVLLLSPRPAGDGLRRATADCADRLATGLEAVVAGGTAGGGTGAEGTGGGPWAEAVEAKHRLMSAFTATPFRPIGLATSDQALANVIEILEWCTSLISDIVNEGQDLRLACGADRDLLLAAAGVLRDVAGSVRGEDTEPDFERLEQLRGASAAYLRNRSVDESEYRAAVHLAFHARTVAMAARTAAADALIASRRADPDTVLQLRPRWLGGPSSEPGPTTPDLAAQSTNGAWRARSSERLAGITAAGTVAYRHASLRSVWFLNSIRGAIGLAAAVAVADLTNVQHAFWVVLGTLSVLRSNASGTGATALRALVGTVVGFAIGGALILAIGTNTTVLWLMLPVSILIAAYTPGTAPFAAGQAAFTVVISILFNILNPVGWKVGVLRIEDVAIGCAVSLVVGVLFWPRGASAVVGDDLADAFRVGAHYLRQATRWSLGLQADRPDAGNAAVTAGVRLDDALRGFLAEQGAKRIPKEDLWRLVGGAMRLRLTAHSLSDLHAPLGPADGAGPPLARLADDLATWYQNLAGHVGRAEPALVLPLGDPPSDEEFVVPLATTGGSAPTGVRRHLTTALWVGHHLNHLHLHTREVIGPADKVAEQRQRPWWR